MRVTSTLFRGDSVEVDAIPARQLREIVEEAITGHIDAPAGSPSAPVSRCGWTR